MSRSADDEHSAVDPGWAEAREELFHMIMEGRSFSGRERNCCFLNTGTARLATVSAVSGLDFPDDARAIAITDWDQDGDEDLWISNRNSPRLRLMLNQAPANNRYLALRLRGNGSTTNRDAIGARVTLEVMQDGRPARLVKSLRAGEGFLSQSSKWIHFGLGDARVVEQLSVAWPGGETEVFTELPTDRRYLITQGEGKVEPVDQVRPSPAILLSSPELPAETRVARVGLETRLPMVSLHYNRPKSSAVTEKFADGQPTLVNLWASWCQPCLSELSEFTAHQGDLEESGLRILAFSVDQANQEQSVSREAVAKIAAGIGFPFDWGYLDADQLDAVQGLHNLLFFLRRPMPLPTSFLVDSKGRLAVIYRGPVSVEELLADVALVAAVDESTPEMAAAIPGRSINHQRVRDIMLRTASQTRHRVASWLQAIRRDSDAMEHFRAMANAEPKNAAPLRRIGKILLDQNRLDAATKYTQMAIERDPSEAETHVVMGLIRSRQNDLPAAETHFREAVAQDDHLSGAHNNLGIALAMQGKYAEARECFMRAVKLDASFAEGHTNLGNIYAAQGDAQQAVQHYLRAIEADSEYVDAYNNLGTLYRRQGNIEKAIQLYRSALEIDPRNRQTKQFLENAVRALQQ